MYFLFCSLLQRMNVLSRQIDVFVLVYDLFTIHIKLETYRHRPTCVIKCIRE